MIDNTIITDTALLEKAKTERREKRKEYQRTWRRNFKAKYGISYNDYLDAKHLKAKENE